ncbi:Hda2p [Lachancea thermotolerans CBS 6340]|uniref:KLTH0G06160p n=1 Tax=Lachancea thermotolerans (strain ATCC 56472 / CBS 6340 / NRRL Y-8284) TaxID=559295 RepID=C5DM57_LACTC|nr:KLTH0G06160p [Lachancea thermotolerans CBS 6340]CAR24868.1 KLTH0G06160p [Lachancea thermotolerans CBS 6340]
MSDSKGLQDTYYLPIGLTSLQKDLVEILISIHTKSLLQYCKSDALSSFPECKSDTELVLPPLSAAQLTGMLAVNIRAAANHPCLLVEHYMPRQLLLMEPGERLIRASDKFRKMAMLLNSIFTRDRKRFPQPMHITILSHSVKELDIIEGYLLGKPIKLKRISGTSLFNEKHLYSDADTSSSTPVPTPTHTKDEYEYGEKKFKSRPSDTSDWLFLATTTHLSRAADLLDDYNIDMVIGFDPLIDENLESFERMRRNGKHVPLIKLLVKDSPDHYVLAHSKTNGHEGDLFLDSLLHFVHNRHEIVEQRQTEWIGDFVEEILSGNSQASLKLPPCNLANGEKNASLLDDLVNYTGHMKLSGGVFDLKAVNQDLDLKLYQNKIMDLIVRRLIECEQAYAVRQEQVLGKRLRETMRQNEIDQIKVESGQMYKKLKEGEGPLNDSTKRLNKAQNDVTKLKEQQEQIEQRRLALQTVAEDGNASEQLALKQEKLMNLRAELNTLIQENSRQAAANDELRLQYQARSSEAANESLVLKTLQKNRDELKARLEGPTVSINSSGALEQESRLREELVRVVQQSHFLQGYIKRIQKQYPINGSQSSKKPATAPGNSRTRSSRSSAPVYT